MEVYNYDLTSNGPGSDVPQNPYFIVKGGYVGQFADYGLMYRMDDASSSITFNGTGILRIYLNASGADDAVIFDIDGYKYKCYPSEPMYFGNKLLGYSLFEVGLTMDQEHVLKVYSEDGDWAAFSSISFEGDLRVINEITKPDEPITLVDYTELLQHNQQQLHEDLYGVFVILCFIAGVVISLCAARLFKFLG